MALSFPGSPSVNQIYVDTTSGNVYQWNGYVWINYSTQNPKNILELDDISGSFDGSETTFALTSGGGPVTPVSDTQIIVNLGGVAQNAGTDFTVSGSNITFTTPPDAVLTFYGFVFGGNLPLTSVDDNSVTPYNLSAGAPVWDSAGNITITGIATIGSSSVVINGTTNRITVGSGATLSSDGITAGVITATSFYGDGSNLENIVAGFPTTASVNTTGIITAASFHGDGSGITNIGGALEPLIYSPGIGETNVGVGSDIVLTFQKPISANVGIVTIQTEELSYTQTLTAADSSNYTVAGTDRDGSVSGTDPAITINVGDTIVFNNTVSGAHPLYIRVSDGGASVSEGTLTGEGTATTTWDTFGVTPGTYYYQCGNHSSMIGQIIVQTNIADEFDVSTVGSSSSITINNAELTLNPGSDLGIGGTNYYVLFPANAFQDTMRTSNSVGISSYYFQTTSVVGVALTAYGYYIAGSGASGIIGQNDEVNRSSPTQIPGTQWSLTAYSETGKFSGGNSVGGITQAGEFYIWGSNNAGHLGQNDTVPRSSPVQVPGTQWRNCFVGPYASFATKTDGTAWCFGDGGSLPLNDTVQRSSPTQIPGTQWTNLRSTISRNGGLGFKSDNTVWLWGYGNFGDFGLNDTVPRSSPTQIPGTQWASIDDSNYVIGGIKTDGTLWVWGYESLGSHGDNGPADVNRSSPIQLPGTQWRTFSASYHCIATKTDGTLWSWGRNTNGQTGQNDKIDRSSPVQIPGTQWGEIIDAAQYKTGALKTDGTLWVWGDAGNGKLGLNNTVQRSSPTQIPGTQWKNFGLGFNLVTFIEEL